MASNLDMFKEVDEAYNSRDWSLYEQFFADNFKAWGLKGSTPHNRTEHIEFSKKFCLRFPDNRVANHPYIAALGDSTWTSTLAVISGSERGSVADNGSTPVGAFEVRFATLARWERGKIVEEFSFLDHLEVQRQVTGSKESDERA
jgi:predicted ester cyclase